MKDLNYFHVAGAQDLNMQVNREIVLSQVSRIFASSEFVAARQLQIFLQYLVDSTLQGNTEGIKGYVIGVDVFDRKPGFDPNEDSIVRVQAGRLRKALKAYYDTTGRGDPLRIVVPKGIYKAEFYFTDSSEPKVEPALMPTDAGDKISLAVLPFSSVDERAAQLGFGEGLVDEITERLARNASLSIAPRSSSFQYRHPTDLRAVGQKLGVRYLLTGTVRLSGGDVRVTIQLTDTMNGMSFWTRKYERSMGDLFTIQDFLADRIVRELRPKLYKRARQAFGKNVSRCPSEWELFLKATWIPEEGCPGLLEEHRYIECVRRLLKTEPNSGKLHSVMADKLAYLAGLDPKSDTEEALAAASAHALRALELEPTNADVTFNVSMHYFHAGNLTRCLSAARRTLELEPHYYPETFFIKALPYICREVPEKVIEELVQMDSDFAPDDLGRCVTLSWVGLLHLNNMDFDQSIDFGWRAREIHTAKSVETTLWFAAALVQKNEIENAVELILEAREFWPTIDPLHYALVAAPRRYGAGEFADRMIGIFTDMADALLPLITTLPNGDAER